MQFRAPCVGCSVWAAWFQSPNGEIGNAVLRPLSFPILFVEFQSPNGEIGNAVASTTWVTAIMLSSFSPLTGKLVMQSHNIWNVDVKRKEVSVP